MKKICKVCGQEFECGSAHKATTCNTCITNGYKYCNECNNIVPVDDFSHFSNGKLLPACKKCMRKRAYVTQSKAKARDPEAFKKRHNESSRRCIEKAKSADPDGFIQKRNEYYRDRFKHKYHTDATFRLAALSRCHDRRTMMSGTLTVDEWHSVCEAFDFKCAYCNADAKLTMEHVVPVARGGLTSANNIVPACKSCNSSKGTKDLIEWYTTQPFYSKSNLEKILRFIKREVM